MQPLAGGWSGQTFLADVAGERSVVRIYATPGHRGPAAHEVDAALLRLVRGLVPVPEVLEVRRADPAIDLPALLVTSYVEGVRGDEVLSTLDDAGLAVVGRHLGGLAATLAGMPMLRSGPFVDGDLTIGSFALNGQSLDGLPAFLDQLTIRGLSAGELDRLRGVLVDAQALLDTVGRVCLVHSDLNPKNVIVDPDTLEVRALVDWEFSHAGHPFADLGNLLRFDRRPAYAAAVLAAWTDRHRVDPAQALALARAADLWALLDLASRAGDNPVATRALGLLQEIARTGDPQAGEPG